MRRLFPSFLLLLFLSCGVFLFFRGFFLHRTEFPDVTSHSDVSDSSLWTAQKARRTILVVIDALRFDMIEPVEPSEEMGKHIGKLQFVREKLALEPLRSSLFKFIADPPTTTFQRLRALTAGTLPTFAEFLDNFDQYVLSPCIHASTHPCFHPSKPLHSFSQVFQRQYH
jgi:GPI ethanolamine phosphate transferase 3 subunit O